MGRKFSLAKKRKSVKMNKKDAIANASKKVPAGTPFVFGGIKYIKLNGRIIRVR
jgi:hypothetical protein